MQSAASGLTQLKWGTVLIKTVVVVVLWYSFYEFVFNAVNTDETLAKCYTKDGELTPITGPINVELGSYKD